MQLICISCASIHLVNIIEMCSSYPYEYKAKQIKFSDSILA